MCACVCPRGLCVIQLRREWKLVPARKMTGLQPERLMMGAIISVWVATELYLQLCLVSKEQGQGGCKVHVFLCAQCLACSQRAQLTLSQWSWLTSPDVTKCQNTVSQLKKMMKSTKYDVQCYCTTQLWNSNCVLTNLWVIFPISNCFIGCVDAVGGAPLGTLQTNHGSVPEEIEAGRLTLRQLRSRAFIVTLWNLLWTMKLFLRHFLKGKMFRVTFWLVRVKIWRLHSSFFWVS